MSIKIPVVADFNPGELKKTLDMINNQIGQIGNSIAAVNKTEFVWEKLKSKNDLERYIKQMQQMLDKNAQLRRGLEQTGQKGVNPVFARLGGIYSDAAERRERMQSIIQWAGGEFAPRKPAPPAPAPGGNGAGNNKNRPPAPPPAPFNWGAGAGAQGMNILGSGLNALGPMGGVVNNAVRTGMSAGAGAGLMGLVGGLVALGVGKALSAVAEKVEQANQNAIGMDKIYRQIGGIGSYGGTRNRIYRTANQLGATYSEMIPLAGQYARQANLGPNDNLMSGMTVGGGLSRSFGLDLSSGMNFIGGMKGANLSQGDQQTRRLGLLIGESIVKAGAFGKADEMMQAVSQFSIAQARMTLTGPNTSGYAGALSALVGMKLPGMDVAGAAGILGQANSAIMHGGNAGEAGQFFTARVGQRMGLNMMQTQMMREGGMFATKNQIFGANSPYAAAFGTGPQGSGTLFGGVQAQMRREYGRNNPMYYQALARYTGLGIGQAMTLDRMNPNQLGGVGDRLSRLKLNLANVNESSYGTLAQIDAGQNLKGIANGYLTQSGKGALSDSEKKTLRDAMAGGDQEKLKDALTKIAAEHGQIETEGSKTRDTINDVANKVQQFADKAVPALNVMRMAMMKLAGGTEAGLQKNYYETEMKGRNDEIAVKYKDQRQKLLDEKQAILNKGIGLQDMEHPKERKRLVDINAQLNDLAGQESNDRARAEQEARVQAYGTNLGVSATRQEEIKNSKLGGSSYTRMDRLSGDFEAAASKYGVDADDLRAIAATESHFDGSQTSSAGAAGVMQLMPINQKGINPRNDRQNIFRGAEVWKMFLHEAGGDKALARRMYNGGFRPKDNKENLEYPLKVEHNLELIKQRNEAMNVSPDAKNPGGAPTEIKGQFEIDHKYPDGSKDKTITPGKVQMKSQNFNLANSWNS